MSNQLTHDFDSAVSVQPPHVCNSVAEEATDAFSETFSDTFSETFMEELRKLLGFQYYFLSRVYARSGNLPGQLLEKNLSDVDVLLGEVFTDSLDQEQRDAVLASLELFFKAAQTLSDEMGEMPRFDDVWERYETLIFEEAGDIGLEEELAS